MTDRSFFDRAIAIAACTANEQLPACGAFDEAEPGPASASNDLTTRLIFSRPIA